MTDSPRPSSPVRVRAQLDEPLRRWFWLVKWFLAIPHLVVLVFLWLAFLVLTVVAGVSIAFTGRYPKGIFDFNVGVLRWSWRVDFYAFTLGTDRYPPFTRDVVDDYPAQLEIDYPERLSRGLVWVKWWLLAIPHYLIITFFSGGANFGGGLIGVLALVAGVFLVVKRQYPRAIFDFIMGMHRWSWRVVAYAALMRDEYPPFRLDTGPDEPGVIATPPPPAGSPVAPSSPPPLPA
jgi:Domain of unknown function (DUF4389)